MAFSAGSAYADSSDVQQALEAHQWRDRVMVVFTPGADDSQYRDQLAVNIQNKKQLAERDFAVWQVIGNDAVRCDDVGQPMYSAEAFRQHFNVRPAAFTVIILGKDGDEKLRSDKVVTAEALAGLIDAMPMRKREMQR